MAKLKWIKSYGTFKFDTPDGDLGKNDYAVHPSGGYCVRLHPKNNAMHTQVDKLDPRVHKNEVAILDGEIAYYHEFEMSSGRILRKPTTKEDYEGKTQVKNVIPEKEMTRQEEIIEENEQDAWENNDEQ